MSAPTPEASRARGRVPHWMIHPVTGVAHPHAHAGGCGLVQIASCDLVTPSRARGRVELVATGALRQSHTLTRTRAGHCHRMTVSAPTPHPHAHAGGGGRRVDGRPCGAQGALYLRKFLSSPAPLGVGVLATGVSTTLYGLTELSFRASQVLREVRGGKSCFRSAVSTRDAPTGSRRVGAGEKSGGAVAGLCRGFGELHDAMPHNRGAADRYCFGLSRKSAHGAGVLRLGPCWASRASR